MKTIVHLIPGLYLGGSEKVLELIAEHQIKSGDTCIVIAFERSGNEIHFSKLKIVYCFVEFRDSLFSRKGIKIDDYESIITLLKPDIVHSHSYWTDLISHYHLRKSILYISHFHLCYNNFDNFGFSILTSKSFFTWIDKLRLLSKYRQPNCRLLAASPFIESFLVRRLWPSLVRKLNCIPNPIDDRYFNNYFREKRYDLLTIGRLEEIKDHKFLILVVKALKDLGMPLKLAIVGDGTLRDELHELTLQLGISDLVDFAGIVKDLLGIFEISKIYLHASKSETFGLSIFEAMAAGLPVIVREFEGIDRSFLNSGNAIVVKNLDITSFVNEIVKLIQNELIYNKLSVIGKRSVLPLASREYLSKLDLYYTLQISKDK